VPLPFEILENIWRICHAGGYSNVSNPLWRDINNCIMGVLKNRTSFLPLFYYYWRLGVRIRTVFYHLPDTGTIVSMMDPVKSHYWLMMSEFDRSVL